MLLLAHHYHCSNLQAEAVQYVAQRLASLLVLPDARQGLLRLPDSLLQQLLCCEVLEVEQVRLGVVASCAALCLCEAESSHRGPEVNADPHGLRLSRCVPTCAVLERLPGIT